MVGRVGEQGIRSSVGVHRSSVKVWLLLAVRAIWQSLVLAIAITAIGTMNPNRMCDCGAEDVGSAVLALPVIAVLLVVLWVARLALLGFRPLLW